MKGTVVIETGAGGNLGSGHAQRMALLAHFLELKRIPAVINPPLCPDFLSQGAEKYFVPADCRHVSLIIRDKRDSNADEMRALMKTAPVIAVDDAGPGRYEADLAVDLLPGPFFGREREKYRPDCFIYGWNFYSSLKKAKAPPAGRDIDFLFYSGNGADTQYADAVVSLLPHGSVTAVCSPHGRRIAGADIPGAAELSWAEILLRSKFLVSHFGISLFEGALAGCGLISINPTEYHSGLAEFMRDEFRILNCGTAEKINREHAAHDIAEFIRQTRVEEADTGAMIEQINANLERFAGIISEF